MTPDIDPADMEPVTDWIGPQSRKDSPFPAARDVAHAQALKGAVLLIY